MKRRITNKDLLLAIQGICPICKRSVKGWKPYFGIYANQWHETLKNEDVNWINGHSLKCKGLKEL